MQPVTAAEVREWSHVPFDELGYPAPEDADPDPLDEQVARVEALIYITVGWFPSTGAVPPGPPYNGLAAWAIPTNLEPIMREAIQLGTEWEAYRSQPENIEGLVDIDSVVSFQAGGYTETRFGARGRGIGTQALVMRQELHPWPRLNQLLSRLLNPILSGGEVPSVRAPGMPGAPRIRWDVARYIMDAGTPFSGSGVPFSLFDERPGGQWFVPGSLPWWP